jgi:hypothetical protein
MSHGLQAIDHEMHRSADVRRSRQAYQRGTLVGASHHLGDSSSSFIVRGTDEDQLVGAGADEDGGLFVIEGAVDRQVMLFEEEAKERSKLRIGFEDEHAGLVRSHGHPPSAGTLLQRRYLFFGQLRP